MAHTQENVLVVVVVVAVGVGRLFAVSYMVVMRS